MNLVMEAYFNRWILGLAGCLLWVFPLTGQAQPPALSLISAAPTPATHRNATGNSAAPSLSHDGRMVAFVSAAPDLVTNDFNGELDIFVRARTNGPVRLVSVDFRGERSANGPSYNPTISSNGQFILFESRASNLVPNDTNGAADVFLRDLAAETTVLISHGTNGEAANRSALNPVATPDFKWVTFESTASNLVPEDTNNATDVFLWERATSLISLVSVQPTGVGSGNGFSSSPTISDDGLWVAFQSTATNLVSTADRNNLLDVFLRDLSLGVTKLISTNKALTGSGDNASWDPKLSGNGKFLTFRSLAFDILTGTYQSPALKGVVRDLEAGSTRMVSSSTNSMLRGEETVINAEGTVAACLASTLGLSRVFIRDAQSGTATGGREITGSTTADDTHSVVLSRDGSQLLFHRIPSSGTNRTSQLWRYDNTTRVATLFSTNTQGKPFSGNVLAANFSGDGQTVAIQSDSSEIATGTDGVTQNIYVGSLSNPTWELITERHPARTAATAFPSSIAQRGLSDDGRFLLISVGGTDFPSPRENTAALVLADLQAGTNSILTVASNGLPDSHALFRGCQLSGDGRFAAYLRKPTDLPGGATNGYESLYVRDILSGKDLLASPGNLKKGEVSVANAPYLSRTGNPLIFHSTASNVVVGETGGRMNLYAFNPLSAEITNLTRNGYASLGQSVISPDSRYVLFRNSASVYLRDLSTTNNVTLTPEPSSFVEAGLWFTQDSRTALFLSGQTIYGYALENRTGFVVATSAYDAAFSRDGRFAAVEQTNDSPTHQTFVYDLVAKTNLLVTAPMSATADSTQPLITPDGRWVVFRSHATNLVPQTTSGAGDLYLRDLRSQTIFLLSRNPANTQGGDALSANAQISFDGSTVAFESFAGNLVAGDYNQSKDVFVLRLGAGDSDNDGMDDAWELTYFGSLARNGTGDFDSDGVSDLDEFRAGTDPTDQGSAMRALALFSLSSGETKVMWSSVPGKTYRVQYTDSVLNPEWHVLVGDITATSSTSEKQDTTSAGIARRFYRVLLVN